MLDVSIDLGFQSALVRFNKGELSRTIDVDGSTMLDLASDGTVLGVEFLYFGGLNFTRESLALIEGLNKSEFIDAVLEAQSLVTVELSNAGL